MVVLQPCQLKEKRRIQEAGGFVSLNGVWRVMGVLATSRALGDYPLKDKKVVVCDPDILTFSIKDHKMHFAGKAPGFVGCALNTALRSYS